MLVFQEPFVKSGISIGMERLATDHSLNGPNTLQDAASYTSISTGKPFLRQSINRQSIKKSIPPWPPTSLAISCILFTIGGLYFSSIALSSSSEYQFLLCTGSE